MGSLVSLVMTDIVDSTRRWNAAEGAMAADLEQHDRLVRSVVEGAGGTVFKHTGDGMIAVFDDPVAAAGTAAGIQHAMAGTVWQQPDGLRVRAAVHTGVVYPRDGDLFGTAVNRLARLLARCPAGAVLVSGATTVLLADRAPEGLVLHRVGPVDLPGFTTPDDTHALVGAGQEPIAPFGAPVEAESTVPAIHDELIGRDEVLASIWDGLARSPLVTLVGVGGMGKTRLALEVAAGAVAACDGAVWWVDLANATSADAVVPVALAAVGARESPGRTALQALCERFTGLNGLLVVDNCEHVLAAARVMVDAVRSSRPAMRIVCTSREALGLRGEQIVAVGSLPVDDSVALFRERAAAVRPDLDTLADDDVIRRICTRLDGIPLGIELAAARCRSMTPTEIDTRLGDRFRLLRGGRDGAERHRTLQAAVAWSYSLLEADERQVFDRMAVFGGGTLIDGLVAVTGFDEFDLLDVVDRLVARCMVVATRTPLGTRYHQLETLRQYAEDRLVEAGTVGEVGDAHVGWMLALAGDWFRSRGIGPEAAAMSRFAAEIDNLRVGVAHALQSDRRDTAHTLVALVGSQVTGLPAYEVADWVRPFPAGHRWDELSATCAALGVTADSVRGLRHVRASSVTDVPEWYGPAPVAARNLFVLGHLTGGGDPQVADDLLDAMDDGDALDGTDEEAAGWNESTRVLAWFQRQMTSPIDDAETASLVELAERSVDHARRSGSVLLSSWSATWAAFALAWRRPELAAGYARGAVDTARRLRADAPMEFASAALGLALSSSPSAVTLSLLRDRAGELLRRNQTHTAGAMVWSTATAVAARDPGAVLRLWAVWRRDTGVDSMSFLHAAGVAVPPDAAGLAGLEQAVADVSVADSIGDMLTALDQVIADLEAVAGAEGGGGC